MLQHISHTGVLYTSGNDKIPRDYHKKMAGIIIRTRLITMVTADMGGYEFQQLAVVHYNV